MKKQFVIAVVTILLFVCFSGCQEIFSNNKNDTDSNYITYENIQKGFSIKYPKNWNKYENPSQIPEVDVLFASSSSEPTKTGNLMISIIENSNMTMKNFKNAHIENSSKIMENFTITSESWITLSGLSAYKLVFTFKSDKYVWRQLEVWTKKDDTFYLIVHQADQAYYQNFVADIEYMIESFKIKDMDDSNEENNDSNLSTLEKLTGTWTTDDQNAIFTSVTFYNNYNVMSSVGEAVFELTEDGELILDFYDSGGGIYTFNYSFSGNNHLVLTDVNMGNSFDYIKQTDQTNQDDFNKFIGSWGDGDMVYITFYQDGSYSSGNDGTFTLSEDKLILTDIYGTIDRFDYVFSDNDKTLTLTEIEDNEVSVLTKME